MTTPTTQPDRCEQIARDLLQTWKNGHLLSESDFQREGRLLRVIKSALRAAKQQGREEGLKESMMSHEDMIGVVATEAAESIALSQQQPKIEPSRECMEIAREIIPPWDPYCHELQSKVASALQSKQDEINELRDKLKASQPTSPPPQTPHQ